MASNDFLNQLAKKSAGYKAGVFLGVVVFVGVLYYQFGYSSMVEERDGLANRKRTLLTSQAKLDKDLADKKKLAEQNEELQRTIRDNQKALPTEAELPAFFDHLQRKAGDAGVNIRRWDRRPENDVDIYIRVPVDVEITGSFHGIMRYFALLGDDSRPVESSDSDSGARVDERIVSIENLYLGDSKRQDGQVVLTARFTASTFRQQGVATPPPGAARPAPAKKTPGAAKAAADKVEKAGKDRAKKVDEKAAKAK